MLASVFDGGNDVNLNFRDKRRTIYLYTRQESETALTGFEDLLFQQVDL